MYDFMMEVFVKIGVPEADARICSDVLIASDLSGMNPTGSAD
jgi:LDH2 family malate/lactate/ureidoglycolate dehydrogenase